MATIKFLFPKRFQEYIKNYTFVLIWFLIILSQVFSWSYIRFIKTAQIELYTVKYSEIYGTVLFEDISSIEIVIASGIFVCIFNFIFSYLFINKYRSIAVLWNINSLLYNIFVMVYILIIVRVQ